jgi:hypothetical protein
LNPQFPFGFGRPLIRHDRIVLQLCFARSASCSIILCPRQVAHGSMHFFEPARTLFNANAFSERVEGWRSFVTPWMAITPYAAARVTALDHPAHDEGCLSPPPTRLRAAAMPVPL